MASADAAWQPRFGAWVVGEGTRFRVWAPTRERVEVVLESGARAGDSLSLARAPDALHAVFVPGVGAGDRYWYRLDGEGPFPDPVSRCQPAGVHASSEVIDPRRFGWSDGAWRGVALEDLVVYELHVGTFSPAGTFGGVAERLSYLRALGVTAIELMPLADFPGCRNWGYDGVSLFAPARCYGTPDDLRRLVDTAHAAGIGVLLDVVYNHFGPDGAYVHAFSPWVFSKRHRTPWGDAINLDGPHSDIVRALLIENAIHWIREYHFDGLRLDATHALIDDGPRHFVAELAAAVHAAVSHRQVLVIAEDERNLVQILRPERTGGWGVDAVWADDFHHQVHTALTGEHDGYYADYAGTATDLAETLRHGWFYHGQHSAYRRGPRGSDPVGIEPRRFVICLQNHDQIGNRAFGDRLHQMTDLPAYRAASVLFVLAPETPLLFMGQEWAASAPFRYFTDHHQELGRLVTEGRRREFSRFAAFQDQRARDRIPDPQAEETFESSRLDWSELGCEPHRSVARLYAALLALRRTEAALRSATWDRVEVLAAGDQGLLMCRGAVGAPTVAIGVWLRGAGVGEFVLPQWVPAASGWQRALTTEDGEWCADPVPPEIEVTGSRLRVTFHRPGAVVLRC
jgi:maltooligosyltrehalose trehalohydrolase